MNYKAIYDNLIVKATKENLLPNVYYENHHIIPKCIGGNDDITNMVKLTPEQHYVAHQLLVKIYPDNPKLIFACTMMCMHNIGNTLGNRTNNKLFGWLRRRFMETASITHRNRFAVLSGFIDYDDQATVIWNDFIHNNITTREISKQYKISKTRVCGLLAYYADKYGLYDLLINTRYNNKSKISKNTRNNISEEQEQRRLFSCAKVDWKAVHQKTGKLKLGKNNPVAVSVIIDGVEYGTIREAANLLGIPYHICNKRLKSSDYPNYIRK